MKSTRTIFAATLLTATLLIPVATQAQDNDAQGWYLKPLLAISQLSDQNGNAFMIIGVCLKAARDGGLSQYEIEMFLKEATRC